MVALEAGAASIPVVGSRIPGLEEAVEDGSTAILQDVKDVNGMADSVVRLLVDTELARKMGAAAVNAYGKSFRPRLEPSAYWNSTLNAF